jgi:uncharacterized lipoprotein
MDSKKIVIVFVVGLLAIGVLSACNLASRVTSQVDQSGTATAAPTAVTTEPTAMPLLETNAAKPTAGSATMTKQPSTVANKPPTPTKAPMAQSSSKKQGDDLEEQLNQLLNGIDSTDTVNDASK